MDFGKFVFEQNKKAQSARRKQKQIHIKEVKFRPGTLPSASGRREMAASSTANPICATY
jgi:hypothetical protein